MTRKTSNLLLILAVVILAVGVLAQLYLNGGGTGLTP